MGRRGEQCALPWEGGGIARGTSQGFPGRHRTATNQNFSEFVTGNRDYLKYVLSLQSTDRVRSEARLLLLQTLCVCSLTIPATQGLTGP